MMIERIVCAVLGGLLAGAVLGLSKWLLGTTVSFGEAVILTTVCILYLEITCGPRVRR